LVDWEGNDPLLSGIFSGRKGIGMHLKFQHGGEKSGEAGNQAETLHFKLLGGLKPVQHQV